MSLYTDEDAREAIAFIRKNIPMVGGMRPYNDAVMRLVGYVVGRLPVETKPARTVMWTLPGEGLGNAETVFEDELPEFIAKIVGESAHSISISSTRPKNVR